MRRFELLLNRRSEAIRIDKEKVRKLTDELETSEKQLRLKRKEFESLQVLMYSVLCRRG